MAAADIAGTSVPASRIPRTCFSCDQVFYRQSRGDRDALKCCSRECGWAWQRAKAAACIRAIYRVYRPKQVKPRACPDCGVSIGKGRQRCEQCRDLVTKATRQRATEAYRIASRTDGRKAARRKARKLKLRGVKVEAVNPLTVLERDRWQCQLCGVSTPKRLRGTYDERAPEVDHIIPIAEGGEHSYRNTQCACRACNLAKSGKAKGQMWLFG